MLRAFDHICMEKARHKFLIIDYYYNRKSKMTGHCCVLEFLGVEYTENI